MREIKFKLWDSEKTAEHKCVCISKFEKLKKELNLHRIALTKRNKQIKELEEVIDSLITEQNKEVL